MTKLFAMKKSKKIKEKSSINKKELREKKKKKKKILKQRNENMNNVNNSSTGSGNHASNNGEKKKRKQLIVKKIKKKSKINPETTGGTFLFEKKEKRKNNTMKQNMKRVDNTILDKKCKNIMNDENLSKSKKKKLIKECKKKVVIENYDYYKKLRLYFNELLQAKDKAEKKKRVTIIWNELKKVELIKFARTNLGYHVMSSLIINAEEEDQNKLWEGLFPHFNNIGTCNFVSLIFQCFYKHAKSEKIKNDIFLWLLNHSKLFLTKFASRLWHTVFKKLKTAMRIKMINFLLIPNINDIKNISPEILKKAPSEMIKTFNEENKMSIKKYLMETIENIVEKELLYNIVSHNILLAACEILNEEELINVMEIIHEGCEYLISTNIGNKALIYLLGYSTSKHKKNLIKLLKNNIVDLCKNSVNFLLVIRLLKITDDTKILNDMIVQKIVSDFENLLNDYYGFYVILEFFYDINEHNEDKYFNVTWKNMIYSKAVKSVKDGYKRKSEIIQPIIEQLLIVFQDKNKLNKYLKDKRYIFIIYEFLSYTQNEQVLKNLLFFIEQIIYLYKNEANINEMYNCKHINDLFRRFFTSSRSYNLLSKMLDGCTFYEKLCNIFLLDIEIVLKSELIKTFNNLFIFVKQKDINMYEIFLTCTGQVNNREIYNELKQTTPKLTYFNKYLELINVDINMEKE
ncbi:mRNA binding Pumilio-homology domain protein, putative [Plasmodium malariae]|uniref:mRNA binding Pumilio-homology domain protein, putative n=1 Tax=Plasmodium malariae TaxID=5858 RepID=A0A1C3KZN9_PLAMA|nr:mRNA binding Pumilio-homology domain protein, putative [Plasmodium malariae]